MNMMQSSPVNIAYGTVESIDPLEVNVNQKFTITEGFLIVPERLIRYEVSLKHDHEYIDTKGTIPTPGITENALLDNLVIREGLHVGDKVLLLRVQGGQKYVILDRLVE